MRLTVNHPCLSLKLKALQKQLYRHSCLPGGNADRGCAALRASPLMRQAIPIFPHNSSTVRGEILRAPAFFPCRCASFGTASITPMPLSGRATLPTASSALASARGHWRAMTAWWSPVTGPRSCARQLVSPWLLASVHSYTCCTGGKILCLPECLVHWLWSALHSPL